MKLIPMFLTKICVFIFQILWAPPFKVSGPISYRIELTNESTRKLSQVGLQFKGQLFELAQGLDKMLIQAAQTGPHHTSGGKGTLAAFT